MSFLNEVKNAIRHPGKTIRNSFLTGLIVLIPIGVAIWILLLAFDFVINLYGLVPSNLRPSEDVGFWIRAVVFLGISAVVFFAISLLGWLSKQFVGQKLLGFFRDWIQKIPILGTIYSAIDQLLRTFTQDSTQQFRRVVYIEFPRRDLWTVAFVTGENNSPNLGGKHLNVFVPTVPNPTSGYLLFIPEKDVIDAQMSVEEALKAILSLGIADPMQGQRAKL